MNAIAYDMLFGLLRTTLFLAGASVFVFLLLKISRCRSSRLHRTAWGIVLLQGWLFAQIPWTISWTPKFLADSTKAEAVAPLDDVMAASGSPTTVSQGFEPPAVQTPIALPDQQKSVQGHLQTTRSPFFLLEWWPVGLVSVWLIGISALVGIGIWRYVRFIRSLPAGGACSNQWQSEFEAVLSTITPRTAIALHITENIGPLLCRRCDGYSLIVPAALWKSLSSPQRIAILRHELGHYRRGDLWKSLAVRLIALPHWFNPFAWYAVRRFDEAAEWACDQLATDEEMPVTDYANVLLKLCDGRQPSHALLPAVRGSSIAQRIRRLLAQTKEDSTMKKFMICTVAGLVLMAGVLRVQLVAEETAVDKKPSKTAQGVADAAAKTYEAEAFAYEAGQVVLDDLYVWSRRWLQAALDAAANPKEQIAAYRAHSDRMKRIYKRIASLEASGSRGGEQHHYRAAIFYLAEAVSMLKKADSTGRDTVTLDIKANGSITFDGDQMPSDALPTALQSHVNLLKQLGYDPTETTVEIRADRDVKFNKVTELFELCKKAGFDHVELKATSAEKPPPDRQSLVRRLYLDLTGLPPSQKQIDAFIGDTAKDPDAYKKLVDRLLKS